jgi:hypothetical protein
MAQIIDHSPAHEAFVMECLREVARQPAVYEVDGIPRGTGWDIAWLYDMSAFDPTAMPGYQHSDLTRRLRVLLDAVLAGQITVLEADQTYRGSGRGRPRRFADFGAFLADQIRYAEGASARRELCALLAHSGRHPSRGAAIAHARRVDVLLRTTGKDHADRLRDLRAELEDALRMIRTELRDKMEAKLKDARRSASQGGST